MKKRRKNFYREFVDTFNTLLVNTGNVYYDVVIRTLVNPIVKKTYDISPLFAYCFDLINEFQSIHIESLRGVKKLYFLSIVKDELLKIKKEKKFSVLSHPAFTADMKNTIYQILLERFENIYISLSSQFSQYYSKRQKYIFSLMGLILSLASTTSFLYLKKSEYAVLFKSISISGDSISLLDVLIFISLFVGGSIDSFYFQGSFGGKILSIARDLADSRKNVEKEINKILRFNLRGIANTLFFPTSYETTLRGVAVTGLEEGYDPSTEVDTNMRRYTENLISKMNRGSFGVAGPRGTGKTTLLKSMKEQDESGKGTIYVRVSAPVAYDAREFILYLYAEVCRAVANRLDPQGRMRPYFGKKWSLLNFFRGVFRWEIILAAIIIATSLFYRSGAVMEYYEEVLKSYTIDADVLDIILKYSFLLVLVAFLMLVWIFNVLGNFFRIIFFALFPKNKDREPTLKKTYSELHKIKYQQTLSVANGGKLNLSIFEASSDQSATFQEYEMSLPEVAHAYSKFIETMADKYRFIIAIDEMDKIEDPLQAQAFLNDLKNILNLESCFYLVSVSENAMSAFELRGLPFRDAFDSTFDEVIHLTYIDLKQTKEIISRRLIGFPEPFLQLAYALSGGLPRDLIRATRKMVMSVSENNSAQQLSDVSNMLLREDLINKINAVRHQVQEKGLNIKAGSYMRALDVLETNIEIDNLNRQGKSLVKSARGFIQKDGLVEIQSLIYNLGIYMLYISTLLAFFAQVRTEDDFKLAADSHLDQLVTARQRIGLSSDYALVLVNQFRKTFRMPVVRV